jgi:hypothetical protein
MGYIITSSPIAEVMSAGARHRKGGTGLLPTDGERDAYKSALLQRWTSVSDKVSNEDTDQHGQEDPNGEEAIEKTERLKRRESAIALRLLRPLLFNISIDSLLRRGSVFNDFGVLRGLVF